MKAGILLSNVVLQLKSHWQEHFHGLKQEMKIWFLCSLKIMHSSWKYSQFVVVCNCLLRGVSGGLQILLWGPTSLGQRRAATTRHMCCLWRTTCLWNAAHATTALLLQQAYKDLPPSSYATHDWEWSTVIVFSCAQVCLSCLSTALHDLLYRGNNWTAFGLNT